MAAEFLLTFALQEMLDRVGSLAVEGITLAWGFQGKLEKLEKSTIKIQAVLEDAGQRPVADKSARLWLEELRDIAYDAEDVLDKFAYEILRQKVENQNNFTGKVGSFFSSSNPIAFRLNMALKTEKINKSLDELGKDAARYGLINRVQPVDRTPQINLYRETDSFIHNSEFVIGREDDVSKVVNLLSSSSTHQQDLSVIPIVGMGGLGKTTLAKLVCEVVKQRKLFDVTFWICVSNGFDDRNVLGGMLETLGKNTGATSNIDTILRDLGKELEGKKFLLVLDDVWNEEHGKWDSLKLRLLKIVRMKGNVVLVTTRSERVASTMETSSSECWYRLRELSDDVCWSIIRERVIENGGAMIAPEMEGIGKDISRKCAGTPLVAQVLGGTLRSKREKHEWESIQKSKIWDALEDQDRTLRILKLSFDSLSSPSVKRCFAYCSIFPKDFFIEKAQLIQLWMAEGLLRPFNERIKNLTKEDIGDMYFHDLLAHSLFQDVQRDGLQNIIGCKMHDLVHDLSLLVSKSETLICEAGSVVDSRCTDCSSIKSRVRNLNLISPCETDESVVLSVRKLRTFFSSVEVLESWKFKGLRTLNLSGSAIKELPASIGKLKLLRYLDVSSTKIQAFPKSIANLYHLQTLRAINCWSLSQVPKKMKNLVSLRHLYLAKVSEMPAHLGCLTSLQTLQPKFVVGRNRGHKIEELGCLNELRGELTIAKLELVSDKRDAERGNLIGKAKINKLKLEWSWFRSSSNVNDEDVLEGLQLHPDIRGLEIRCYLGKKLPLWISGLQKLVMLKFEDNSNLKQLPALGHLHYLEILEIDGMRGVSCIGKEFYKDSSGGSSSEDAILFPALKRFSLNYMEGLEEWMVPGAHDAVGGVVVFPCLKELYFKECGKLKQLPSLGHLPCLEILEVGGLEGVSRIGKEFYSGSSGSSSEDAILFPALKSFFLDNMQSLEEMMVPDDAVGGVAVFPCLKELYFKESPKLKQLPSLGHLPCLEILKIVALKSVSFIGKEFYSGSSSGCRSEVAILFPALKRFSLENMQSLEEMMVPGARDAVGGVGVFPCLKELYIENCHKLKQLPSLGHLHCLEILKVVALKSVSIIGKEFYSGSSSGSSREVAIPFPALKRFSLTNMKSLEEWMVPDAAGGVQGVVVFPCLEELDLRFCLRLKSIPSMAHLSSKLVRLDIDCCSLRYFPENFFGCSLTHLRILEIGPLCFELEEYPAEILNSIHHLSGSLKELRMFGWEKLKSEIPRQLQHLTALKKLCIFCFNGVEEALPDWLGNLSSLQKLEIFMCKNLKYLPSSTAMQCLSKLQTLEILDCPLLQENCRRGSGPEWYKISHIPHVKTII